MCGSLHVGTRGVRRWRGGRHGQAEALRDPPGIADDARDRRRRILAAVAPVRPPIHAPTGSPTGVPLLVGGSTSTTEPHTSEEAAPATEQVDVVKARRRPGSGRRTRPDAT